MARSGEGEASAERVVLEQRGGNLTLDLFVLMQHLSALLEEAFAGSGISASQYAVYSQLARGSVTPGELGHTLGLRPATLSGYLATMESRGHVARTRSDADRRSHVLALTPQGRAQWEAGRARIRAVVRSLTTELGGADEVRAMRLLLGRLDDAVLAAAERLHR